MKAELSQTRRASQLVEPAGLRDTGRGELEGPGVPRMKRWAHLGFAR